MFRIHWTSLTAGLLLAAPAQLRAQTTTIDNVTIVDVTNGARLETYTIAGERGSGVIGINGAAAHLVNVGDLVIIITYASMSNAEARAFKPSVVHVDDNNAIHALGTNPAEALADGLETPPFAIFADA